MKLKICGMGENVLEVAKLEPDYLGFIFWEPSSRFFKDAVPDLLPDIDRVGVFVDASLEEILAKIDLFNLHAVQLHGDESPEFCEHLKTRIARLNPTVKIIKVFKLNESFDFSILKDFEPVSDFFLFDTKGKLPGGNGLAFNWRILDNYPSEKPFFLSGGIGLEDIDKIESLLHSPIGKYCYALDINSRFESEPGIKKIPELQEFIKNTKKIIKQ